MATSSSNPRLSARALAALTIVMLCVAFNSGYALKVTDTGSVLTIPLLLLPILTLMMLFRATRRSRRLLLCYVVFVVAFALSFAAHVSFSTLVNTAIPLLTVSLAYVVVTRIAFTDFAAAFVVFMRVAVGLALGVYVLTNWLGVDLGLPVICNSNGVAMESAWLFFLLRDSVGASPAMGPFWEPGVLASFTAIAAVLEITRDGRQTSVPALIVFALGLLATRTSAGFILLLLVVLVWVAHRFKRAAVATAMTGALLVVLVIAFPGTLVSLGRNSEIPAIADAFDVEAMSTGTRVNSPQINLLVFAESPVFGAGLGEVGARYASYTASLLAADSQTSTSTYMLAALGLLGAAYTLFWCLGILRSRWLSFAERVLVLSIFLLIVNKEPHMAMVASYCFMFYFLSGMDGEFEGLAASVPLTSGIDTARPIFVRQSSAAPVDVDPESQGSLHQASGASGMDANPLSGRGRLN